MMSVSDASGGGEGLTTKIHNAVWVAVGVITIATPLWHIYQVANEARNRAADLARAVRIVWCTPDVEGDMRIGPQAQRVLNCRSLRRDRADDPRGPAPASDTATIGVSRCYADVVAMATVERLSRGSKPPARVPGCGDIESLIPPADPTPSFVPRLEAHPFRLDSLP